MERARALSTDRRRDETTRNSSYPYQYARQLALYAEAVRRATGMEVERVKLRV